MYKHVKIFSNFYLNELIENLDKLISQFKINIDKLKKLIIELIPKNELDKKDF